MPFPLSEKLLEALAERPQTLGELAAHFRTVIPPEYSIRARRIGATRQREDTGPRKPVTLTKEIQTGARAMVRSCLHSLKYKGMTDQRNGLWVLTAEAEALGKRICAYGPCTQTIGYLQKGLKKYCSDQHQRAENHLIDVAERKLKGTVMEERMAAMEVRVKDLEQQMEIVEASIAGRR